MQIKFDMPNSLYGELEERLGCDNPRGVAEAIREQLIKKATGDVTIFTNCRGFLGDGRSLDGSLDGWCWQAWSGATIAYGPTEDGARHNLRMKLEEARTKP